MHRHICYKEINFLMFTLMVKKILLFQETNEQGAKYDFFYLQIKSHIQLLCML